MLSAPAAVTPAPADAPAADRPLRQVVALWSELERALGVLLQGADDDGLRIERLQALAHRLSTTAQQLPDEALFVMFQSAARPSDRYSLAHALASAAIADLAAVQLGWPDDERRSLMHAGLTMNISITELQNELVHRARPLTGDQRQEVAQHPQRSVAMLRAWGVDDALWLGVVAHHHKAPGADEAMADLPPARRLADLLRRADLFLAKVSARASRKGLAVTAAVRQACLGSDGRPDQIGGAILRVLGFYPPGTWVRMANEELAVVLRRGPRADQPLVACLFDERRHPLAAPRVRDTAVPAQAVKAAVGGDTMRLPNLLDTLSELPSASAHKP